MGKLNPENAPIDAIFRSATSKIDKSMRQTIDVANAKAHHTRDNVQNREEEGKSSDHTEKRKMRKNEKQLEKPNEEFHFLYVTADDHVKQS